VLVPRAQMSGVLCSVPLVDVTDSLVDVTDSLVDVRACEGISCACSSCSDVRGSLVDVTDSLVRCQGFSCKMSGLVGGSLFCSSC
jgi:hypothetical protein